MSGFFGFFHRDGDNVYKETAEQLVDAISYWQPDDWGLWREKSVALGHTMLWNILELKV